MREGPLVDEEGNWQMAFDEGNLALKVSAHTIFDARARWQQRIRFLQVGQGQYRRLAAKLASSEKGCRCKSEADPVCVTLFWQRLCRALGRDSPRATMDKSVGRHRQAIRSLR